MPLRTKIQQQRAQWKRDKRAAIQQRKNAHVYEHPHRLVDLDDRTNITILDPDTGSTILQRLAPTSLTSEDRIREVLREGVSLKEELFDTVQEKLEDPERHGALVCHLGMWYNMHVQVGWTREHDLCKPSSNNMLAWVSSYFHSFVAPLEPLLEEDFKNSLEDRQDGFNWLKEKMPEGHCDLLHPWWTMAAVISGISTNEHPDTRDAEPSILINFGCKVVFEIEGSAVCLHPGDVLIFRARLWHRARPVDGTSAEVVARRFAISLSVRKDIVNMVDRPSTVVRANAEEAGPSSTSTKKRARKVQGPM